MELGGSKSSRTSVVLLDWFERDRRVFVSGIHPQVQGREGATGDDRLLALLNGESLIRIGVNAPLTLPPCVTCALPACPTVKFCEVPEVEWMRKEARRLRIPKAKHPTPYTQRPVDLALRGVIARRVGAEAMADETLGANRAPLAARMLYLRRHLKCSDLLECNPRVSVAGLGQRVGFSARSLRRYRDVEDGALHRLEFLERLAEEASLFFYKADLVALARDLGAFDALMAALMALHRELNLLDAPLFPESWGNVAVPGAARSVRAVREGFLS
ncbi:MAG: hypothetical protein HUU37_05435 [Bdellovibrionales bacterium]|nr:hypothetical protein [Bdellovibrionales bacterium]